MKSIALKLYKSARDIRDFAGKAAHLQSEKQRRSTVPIAVIDDQPFAPQTNLQSYGYNISQIGDIKSLGEVSKYPLILCDIMGVGRHFDHKLQGASLITELKKNYPEKIVIAYTGAALNDRAVKVAADRADRILKKDIDIDEWVDALDRATREAVDPYIIWNKVRARFVEMGVDTKDMIAFEDAYVRSVQSRDITFSAVKAAGNDQSLRSDAKAIVNGVISSLVFQAIFGIA
ncbi:hypothetical protein [Brevundimonas sp. R86498]|uniref:hypothetical protein n=1 Tax=Brevundimonas sp. R86498 TaxID=3093845 RepID=UPI0037C800F7